MNNAIPRGLVEDNAKLINAAPALAKALKEISDGRLTEFQMRQVANAALVKAGLT